MPKLTTYEAGIIDVILYSGRPDEDEKYLTWTAMRPGQLSIISSLVHETRVRRPNISTALNHLFKIELVERSMVAMRQSVRLTDLFHWMMFEAQWRFELYNAAPKAVEEIVAGKGWRWLLYRADDIFQSRKLSYRRVEGRRAVMEELARQVRES
jgi:hypothetical protein